MSAYPSSRESDALNAAARPWTLRDYGFIADGERGALIGPHGDIAWMCAPNWDSDAVFGELIGAPGRYAVTPLEPCVWGGYYEDRSLIWRSRWVTSSAIIECREALAFPVGPTRWSCFAASRRFAGTRIWRFGSNRAPDLAAIACGTRVVGTARTAGRRRSERCGCVGRGPVGRGHRR